MKNGQDADLVCLLKPLANKGTLEIFSDFGHGDIWLGDDFYGKISSREPTVIDVSPGKYVLTIKKEGREYQQEVEIIKDKISTVNCIPKIAVDIKSDVYDAKILYWHDEFPENLDYPRPLSLGTISEKTTFYFTKGGIYWFYAEKDGRVFSAQAVVLSPGQLDKMTVDLKSVTRDKVYLYPESPLLGPTFFAPWELEDFVRSQRQNPYHLYIAKYYLFFGPKLGLSGNLAYAQSILETGFFCFGGDVRAEQNNYAGIGATGGGNKGHTFKSPEEGVLGQFQHLYAYAPSGRYNEPLPVNKYSLQSAFWDKIVDPRYHLVNKGSAPLLMNLSGRWAVDTQYADKICNLHKQMTDFLGY